MTHSDSNNSWLASISVYKHPRVIGMLFLGFAAGLPFPLVFTTLSVWLREEGIEKSTIGFFAWVGITYSIKVFWAPVIDRLPIPLLTNLLGRRRSWMLLAQTGIMLGLAGMAFIDPNSQIVLMAYLSIIVAFSSATQDIAIDAYRIEAVDPTLQGAMAAMYQTGWRTAAALVAGAVALYLAELTSWMVSYLVMAACMSIGMLTVLLIREPEQTISRNTLSEEQQVIDYLERTAHVPNFLRVPVAWFIGAVVCPFTDFFRRNGRWALFLLAFIALYRVSDIVLGNMAPPFYIDLGFSKTEIADITKVFGLIMTLVGSFTGGILVMRMGVLRSLLLGAVLVAVTNLLFAQLAVTGKSLTWLTIVISADNFSAGFAASAFLAFLAQLTNTAYTATQYALFSSLMTLPAKISSGFSGVIVDNHGFVFFFIYAACTGIPAILLVLYLMRNRELILRK